MLKLFQEYYLPQDEIRQKEIDYCFQVNSRLTDLDHFYAIVHNSQERERVIHLCPQAKILQLSLARPSFGQIFALINSLSQAQDVNIFANSDIFFDSGIALAGQIEENQVICLSRWDITEEKSQKGFYTHLAEWTERTQDTWIFRGKLKRELEEVNFTTGVLACDNVLAGLLEKSGYRLRNPCLSLKSYHMHQSEIRYYSQEEFVPGQRVYVPPSYWSRSLTSWEENCWTWRKKMQRHLKPQMRKRNGDEQRTSSHYSSS